MSLVVKKILITHYTNGDVKIGNDVWIGAGVTVISGITIGDGAVVAAN
jgi:acetyltransferase-like isoleucine patch superfamily enzyme